MPNTIYNPQVWSFKNIRKQVTRQNLGVTKECDSRQQTYTILISVFWLLSCESIRSPDAVRIAIANALEFTHSLAIIVVNL